MKQVIQHLRTGEIEVAELPRPVVRPDGILVANAFSLISSGTERTTVGTAKPSLLGKALSRPDLVAEVVANVRREGVTATINKVRTRLESYKELGYSSAGVVVDSTVDEFKRGMHVACAGVAFHAELIYVPKNLAVAVPNGVSLDEAAFTTLGAISLHSVHQASVQVGESVAVIGLGLLGLITVQILRSAGCKVIGLDVLQERFPLARELGCDLCLRSEESAVRPAWDYTRGLGVDRVVVTAATKSSEPVRLGIELLRDRGRLVVVGAVGMEIPRGRFYEKELELRISRSYGPGRYDPQYEQQGIDYPVGYVRWTERRNMQAFLEFLKDRRVTVRPLISRVVPIDDALEAYTLLTSEKTNPPNLGILLQYRGISETAIKKEGSKLHFYRKSRGDDLKRPLALGCIGAGNFAQAYLLPVLARESHASLRGIAIRSPNAARSVGKRFGFQYCTTDPEELLRDDSIDAVVIATRHDSHADLVVKGLQSGKHVFVEKPLAIDHQQLAKITSAYASASENRQALMVGFNRRFARPMTEIREFLSQATGPKFLSYRVNAGRLPPGHWLKEKCQGGRIVGEVCHFVDAMLYLTGSKPLSVHARSLPPEGHGNEHADSVVVVIGFSDGSVGTIGYFPFGSKSLGKEYCEVHSDGLSALMKDFTQVEFYGSKGRRSRRFNGDKGHREELRTFIDCALNRSNLNTHFLESYYTSMTTLAVIDSLRSGAPQSLDLPDWQREQGNQYVVV